MIDTVQRTRRRIVALVLVSAIASVPLLTQGCGTSRPEATNQSPTGPGTVLTGPCTQNGATAECHVETGRIGTIVNCFSGTQTCQNGVWSACGAASVGTLSTFDLRLGDVAGGISPLSVSPSPPSADAGGCASNPCNPYCIGIDVDAGQLTTDGGIATTTILGTVKGVSDFPAGAGGPKNAMGGGGTYIGGPPPRIRCSLQPPYPPADNTHCSSDFCCAAYAEGASPSTCQPWVVVSGDNPVATANCAKAPGVDFQVGLACQDGAGNVHVPACNRGMAAATAGSLMVAEYAGNPTYSGTATACNNPGAPSAYCRVNLATIGIASGKCIDINVNDSFAGLVPGVTCNSTFSAGNRTMMINPPATGGYVTLAEGDPCNNYGFHPTTAQGGTCSAYGTQPPPPAAESFYYTATCPTGSAPAWNQFAYDTTVPNKSEVLFRVSTAPLLPDGGTGTFTAPVTAGYPANPVIADPAVCAISGPAPCPKNLYTLLGGPPGATNPVLKLDVTVTAFTAVPKVNSWRVTYNCVPNE